MPLGVILAVTVLTKMAVSATDGAGTGSVDAERMRSVENMVMKMDSFILRATVWGWSIEVLDGGSHALDQRVRKSTTLFILYVYELVISCPILKISKPNLGLN